MSLLAIDNLSLSIGRYDILKNVSLDVAPGEIVAVTGESGSGKSMTALSVMQLLPDRAVTKGQITLDGHELLTTSEAEMCSIRGRLTGMVFQEPMTALNPVKTIGAQVMETILLHTSATRAEAETRARDVLDRVGLPQSRFPLGRFPHELSGGQRQRVVIAMAIALRPKLLIADEPTTAEWYISDLEKFVAIAFDKMGEAGATIQDAPPEMRQQWADNMDNVAKAWATQLDGQGLPATEMLSLYMEEMRAAGAVPLRDWDKE